MAARNVWSVERKPTGKDSDDTIELTKLAQQRIIHQFEMAISKANPAKLERKKEASKVLLEMLRDFS
jgi:hypothetical protein